MRELWKATVRKPAPAVPVPDQAESPAQEASASS
jgi:hypothetical protein